MRKRNIKINVYLNEEEKKMLEEKSNEARLSQSDFIRNIITQKEISNVDYENIFNVINDIKNDLLKLKNRMRYLGYYNEENFVDKIIIQLDKIKCN